MLIIIDCLFFQEYLQNQNKATGICTGCVKFYNYVKVPKEYIVLERLDDSLNDYYGAHKNIKIILVAEFLSAVEYLHNFGVVHGDLKPSNVVVTSDKKGFTNGVKLIDLDGAQISKVNNIYNLYTIIDL